LAVKKQMCVNHPDRSAIGVCVITHKPICSECSTRYEGVNYSREGLAILKKQRAGSKKRFGGAYFFAVVAVWLLAPVLFALLYLFYLHSATSVIDLMQADFTHVRK
jgi:hypothetical protein